MPEIIYVSDKTIYNDLKRISEEHGKDIILLLLAKIISENYWWNWPDMKKDIHNSLNQNGGNNE